MTKPEGASCEFTRGPNQLVSYQLEVIIERMLRELRVFIHLVKETRWAAGVIIFRHLNVTIGIYLTNPCISERDHGVESELYFPALPKKKLM